MVERVGRLCVSGHRARSLRIADPESEYISLHVWRRPGRMPAISPSSSDAGSVVPRGTGPAGRPWRWKSPGAGAPCGGLRDRGRWHVPVESERRPTLPSAVLRVRPPVAGRAPLRTRPVRFQRPRSARSQRSVARPAALRGQNRATAGRREQVQLIDAQAVTRHAARLLQWPRISRSFSRSSHPLAPHEGEPVHSGRESLATRRRRWPRRRASGDREVQERVQPQGGRRTCRQR